MSTPAPDLRLQATLGSIVVHVEEMLDEKAPYARAIDETAIRSLLADPSVQDWIEQLRALAMVPVKREASK